MTESVACGWHAREAAPGILSHYRRGADEEATYLQTDASLDGGQSGGVLRRWSATPGAHFVRCGGGVAPVLQDHLRGRFTQA